MRPVACVLLAALLLLVLQPVRSPALAQTPVQPVVEPHDGRQPVLDFIASAQSSIDLAIYELTDSRITTALENAAGRGVRVRVLVEPAPGGHPVNARSVAQLAQHGVETRDASPAFRLTHEKAMVADGASALIMSMNLVTQTFSDSRDFAVLDTDPGDVAEIESVFQSDWDRNPVAAADPALIWSPDNARARLLSLLNSANVTLDIYAEELTDRDVLAALGAALAAGVRVRLLMTDTGSRDPARPGRALLASEGAEVRLLRKPFVHAKVILVDGRLAFAGSQNFTSASLDQNRELGLLTSDAGIIDRLRSVFESDWQQSVPAPPS